MPLKLCASFAKKIPAEVDYSSKSYLASVEVELPSNLSGEELNAEIHKTYAQLERAVDEQINSKTNQGQGQKQQGSQGHPGKPEGQASNKQIAYLLDLAKAREKTLMDLNAEVGKQFGVTSIYELSRKDCSRYLDQLKAA